VRASFSDVSARPPAALGGAPVTFTLGTRSCQATTNGGGVASCEITPAAGGSFALTASVPGTDRYVGATASTAFTVRSPLPPANGLSALGDALLWVGLKNSDDAGTQFDLRVELLKNGAPVATGLQRCITGLGSGPERAREVRVAWSPFDPVSLTGDDRLALRVSARIGTNADGTVCRGPGGSHRSAVGLRLYYDAAGRASHYDATIGTAASQYLHSDGGPCPSRTVTSRFSDASAPTGATAKCADSGKVNFSGSNPFAVIGTWTIAPAP
jgi:hypothetical protein